VLVLIAKIVSGGQTGVDRGALEAAVELGFPYGTSGAWPRKGQVGPGLRKGCAELLGFA